MAEGNYLLEVVHNLRHTRKKWAQLNQVLIREGEYARTLGHIYLVVVQLVLLYGSETWVLTPCMQRLLGIFHHRVERRLMGSQQWKEQDRGWVYPPLEYAMAEAGLQEV